jgi:putative DNA primase/helicase
VQIPKERQDKGLLDKLQATELTAILSWLVNGCVEWQRRELGTAHAIESATAGYRADQDVLGMWIRDRCLMSESAWTSTDALHKDYLEWCKAERIDFPWSRRTLRERLLDRSGIAAKHSPKGDQRGLSGIRLLEYWEGE